MSPTRSRGSAGGAPELSWEERSLPGGGRLLVTPMPGRASVTVSALLDVGSRHESLAQAGISHLLEHMVFKGTRSYPSGRAVSEAIEGVGGILNGATDQEATVFWAKVPAAHLERAVDVLLELAFAPRLDPNELDKERRVVLEELRMVRDQPQELVQTDSDAGLWPAHALGRDPGGTPGSVRRVTPDDLAAHHRRHYRPPALVLSVAGPVRVHQVERLVAPRLAGLAGAAAGAPRTPAPARPLPPGTVVHIRHRRTEQVHCLVGLRAPSYRDPDRTVLDVLNGVLGDGMSSRLFLELREERALAYDVGSFTTRFRDSGALLLSVATEPQQAVAAVTAAWRELGRLAEDRVPAPELRKVQEYLKGRLLLGVESTSAVSDFVGQQALLLGRPRSPGELVAAIDEVDQDAVRELAGRLLGAGAVRAAVVGPVRDPEPFAAALGRAEIGPQDNQEEGDE
ncbi:MAG TPA: pitrilysin family protein [Verrucomicrobiae bacterium]|nr:pitrilysin family protein [Verrucomicrobiae bacterium]